MKKQLLVLVLLISTFTSMSQTGDLLNLSDFDYPPQFYRYSRFWARSSGSAARTPIMEYYGTSAAKFYMDSLILTKLPLREDPNPYKLVWVDNTGFLRAITPPYLSGADTTNKWLPMGTAIPAAQVNSDWNSGSGVSQILNKPVFERIETYLGTTDASGNYTVTYSNPFSVTPDIQPQIQVATINQSIRITSTSATGFTVQVTNRQVLNILGFEVLAGTATPVVGISVGVLVTERL